MCPQLRDVCFQLRPWQLTYKQGKEDVLGALDSEVDWTAVPGAQEAQAEHMHLHDPVCFGVGFGPLHQKPLSSRRVAHDTWLAPPARLTVMHCAPQP